MEIDPELWWVFDEKCRRNIKLAAEALLAAREYSKWSASFEFDHLTDVLWQGHVLPDGRFCKDRTLAALAWVGAETRVDMPPGMG